MPGYRPGQHAGPRPPQAAPYPAPPQGWQTGPYQRPPGQAGPPQTGPYQGAPPGGPPTRPPFPPAGRPPGGYGPPSGPYRGPQTFPPGYPPPGSTTPPWLQGYPGHPGMLRPRPKSNTGPLVATILVAVLVVGAGLIGFLALNDRGDHVADTGYDEPATTGSNESGTTTETSTETTSDDPTTTTDDPTDDPTTEDTPTETTPAGPQPVYTLGDNPLFAGDNGTPAVTCDLARWGTDPQGAAAFFTSAIPCLDAAWGPVLQRAGLPFATSAIEFPEGTEWSSPCGAVSGGRAAAFYCAENSTLYMPYAGLQTEQYGAHPGVYLALLAHEYGHHVQALSGVMGAYADARYNAGVDSEAGLELSRRLELQAQCFSGMFLAATYSRGSVDDNILNEARTTQDRGDHQAGVPRDHGSDAHTSGWWEQGAQKNRTFQCNTWLSPPADVA
ncbi:MAG: metallopeptidase [Actinophytocola sp.]|nr:metallopeptidase [Actinophytocola sp.]